MNAEQDARREIVEAGMAEIDAAKTMAAEAARHARVGASMVAHIAAQSVADQPKAKGQKRPKKPKRADHHR